jgi:hypothetical protein
MFDGSTARLSPDPSQSRGSPKSGLAEVLRFLIAGVSRAVRRCRFVAAWRQTGWKRDLLCRTPTARDDESSQVVDFPLNLVGVLESGWSGICKTLILRWLYLEIIVPLQVVGFSMVITDFRIFPLFFTRFSSCSALIFRQLQKKDPFFGPFLTRKGVDFPPLTEILPDFYFYGTERAPNVKRKIAQFKLHVPIRLVVKTALFGSLPATRGERENNELSGNLISIGTESFKFVMAGLRDKFRIYR